jgi:hypothetical protein
MFMGAAFGQTPIGQRRTGAVFRRKVQAVPHALEPTIA